MKKVRFIELKNQMNLKKINRSVRLISKEEFLVKKAAAKVANKIGHLRDLGMHV